MIVGPVLSAFLLALLGGFLGAFASTESVRRFALRIGAVDYPGGRRVHRSPTARLGGLGIAFGMLFALGLVVALESASFDDRLLAGFLGAVVVALAVGVIDDLRGLGAVPKITGQVLAASILWLGGWKADAFGLPGLGAVSTELISYPLTVLWVVGVINAVNLIDGLDGLAGGLGFVSALAFAGLLATAGLPSWTIAVAFAGAIAGFLWFNLPPAIIFMGDAGSHLLGVALAAFGLRLSHAMSPGMFPLVPMLCLAVPLCDMAWAISRRALAPRPRGEAILVSLRAALARIVRADGAHVHHRLLDAGWTPRAAVSLLWRIAAACAVVGVTLAASVPAALALAAIVAGWLARVVAQAGGFGHARIPESAAPRREDPVPQPATPALEIDVEEIAA